MSEYITPEVKIPQRNLSKELDTIFGAQTKYAQPYYDLEAKFGPLYNRLGLGEVNEQTLGYTDENGRHVPGTLELGRTAAEYQRRQDVGDVEALGGRVTDAARRANPFLERSLQFLTDAENPSPLLRTLNSQAENDLASGGRLSPETERDIREGTRSAWADKGLLNSDQAGVDELLNRENVRAGRIAASRKFAGDVEGLNGLMRDYIAKATGVAATALPDISALILGRPSSPGSLSLSPIGAGTKTFDPFNPYFQDVFSSNQSAAGTQAVANSQAQSATRAAIASIAGGLIGSDIRLKEKIEEVGEAWIPLKPSGWAKVPRYQFEYRAGCVPQGLRPVRYEGLMADDVEAVRPDGVTIDRAGFKQVNYTMLGIEFKEAA